MTTRLAQAEPITFNSIYRAKLEPDGKYQNQTRYLIIVGKTDYEAVRTIWWARSALRFRSHVRLDYLVHEYRQEFSKISLVATHTDEVKVADNTVDAYLRMKWLNDTKSGNTVFDRCRMRWESQNE